MLISEDYLKMIRLINKIYIKEINSLNNILRKSTTKDKNNSITNL